MADHVLVEKTDGVAIITMNRPELLNAMNHRLNVELHEAVTRMNADDDVLPDVDVVAGGAGSCLGGFPCADAPVTTTATSDTTRANVSASFRKTISSP